MNYCYGKYYTGNFSKLKPIQKLVPDKYLFFNCLLNNKFNFFKVNDELIIYNEKGLLKQLDLFKEFENKFKYIYLYPTKAKNVIYKNNYKNILLYMFLINKKSYPFLKKSILLEQILKGTPLKYIKNIILFLHIHKYPLHKLKKLKSKYKYDKNMNAIEEIQWKLKVFKSSKLLKEYEKDYKLEEKKIIEIINNNKNSKEFKLYYNKNKKKFKSYSFTKEIKQIKNSVFFTCKVAKKYKKLFPKY